MALIRNSNRGMWRAALVGPVAGTLVAAGLMGPIQAGQALTVTDTWFGPESHAVHIVGIVENQGDSYVGGIKGQVRLYWAGEVYYAADVEPDKTVLAPGETTVVKLIGPQMRTPDHYEHPPERMELVVDGHPVGEDDYPYAPDPTVAFVDAIRAVGPMPGGVWLRLSGELRNDSSVTYKAWWEQAEKLMAIRSVAVMYRQGEIVGAERLETFSGHLPPGESVVFVNGAIATDEPDEVRVFVAAANMDTGTYAANVQVERVSWEIVVDEEEGCGLAPPPCRRLIADVDVANRSDVGGVVRVGLGVRLVGGRPWFAAGCYGRAVSAGESIRCQVRMPEGTLWWPAHTELARPKPVLEDIQYLTAHVSNDTVTRDPTRAAPKRTGRRCFLPRRTGGAPGPVAAIRLYLPALRGDTNFCTEVRVDR